MDTIRSRLDTFWRNAGGVEAPYGVHTVETWYTPGSKERVDVGGVGSNTVKSLYTWQRMMDSCQRLVPFFYGSNTSMQRVFKGRTGVSSS